MLKWIEVNSIFNSSLEYYTQSHRITSHLIVFLLMFLSFTSLHFTSFSLYSALFVFLQPGQPLEGWEFIYALTMGLSAGAPIFGYGNTDRESFREWARREAVARERIVEEGGELEFGKFYSSKEGYAVESIDVMPVKGGSVEEEEE